MLRVFITLILTLFLLAACSGGDAATPTPQIDDPQDTLLAVVENLRELETFRMLLEQKGAEYVFHVVLDDSGGTGVQASLRRGEAQFVSPDIFYATVSLRLFGLPNVTMYLFADGGDQYFRLPSTQWFHFPFAQDFDAAALIREDSGFQRALTELKEVEYIGEETLIDGTATYHIRGIATAESVIELLFGLLEAQDDVIVDVYVDQEQLIPALLIVTQPETATADEDPTTWHVEFYDINAASEVEYPEDWTGERPDAD